MRLRCPICHAESSIEAHAENISAKEFMVMLDDLPREVARPLLAYLGLWRSASRALSWERALRIADEVLRIEPDLERLGAALSATVESLREKRSTGRDGRALNSHGYLQRVIESGPAAGRKAQASEAGPAASSRTAQALAALQELKHGPERGR